LNPYLALLRTNRNYRLLFIGQTVSQLGDWFSTVAVYALLLDLTGSATAVAWMMIVQFLPFTIVGPMAGVVVDRVNRRRLMIAADLLRGVVVLGLVLIRRPDQVWIAYVVTAVMVSASAFFRPHRHHPEYHVGRRAAARQCALERGVGHAGHRRIGRRSGGVVVGRNAAFVLNAVSFFASAIFIARTGTTRRRRPPQGTGIHGALRSGRSSTDSIMCAGTHVAALLFVKFGWGLAGGVLLLLTIIGQRVFPIGGNSAAGIGLLYGARGVGAALGPIVLRWMLGQTPAALRRTLGPAYFIVGGFYIALAFAPTLWVAAAAIMAPSENPKRSIVTSGRSRRR
jgi:hypothetical protein